MCLQHYSELPDIKRVIVNTHAIEPQVMKLNTCLYISHSLNGYSMLNNVCFSGTCGILRHSFQRMGTRVHERSSTCQFKRKPSDYCPGMNVSFIVKYL